MSLAQRIRGRTRGRRQLQRRRLRIGRLIRGYVGCCRPGIGPMMGQVLIVYSVVEIVSMGWRRVGVVRRGRLGFGSRLRSLLLRMIVGRVYRHEILYCRIDAIYQRYLNILNLSQCLTL